MAAVTRRILVVEDEVALQRLISRRAKQVGIDTLPALSCAEGFVLAMEAGPDLILLDMHLPDGNGIAFLRQIKGDKRTAHIPVVAWSGSDAADSEAEALSAGALAYFEKSDLQRLVQKLKALLNVSDAEA